MKITNYRNAQYMSADNNVVDLEVQTDLYGWIPITVNLSDSDTTPHIVKIKDWITTNTALITAYVAPPIPAPVEITTVSMRQARLALLANNQLATVETALNSLPSPQKEAALIEWNYAASIEKSSPLVTQMAQVLGLDSAGLTALFDQAKGL